MHNYEKPLSKWINSFLETKLTAFQTAYCLSLIFENPEVNKQPNSLQNATLCGLDPSWPCASCEDQNPMFKKKNSIHIKIT